MTLTRSKTGHTPRAPDNPGFVETPRPRRSRKSAAPDELEDSKAATKAAETEANGNLSGATGAEVEKRKPRRKSAANGKVSSSKTPTEDHKVDTSGEFEFGGSLGVTAMMIGFPLLMWYMWIGATYYDGKFPTRSNSNQSMLDFLKHLANLAYVGAFPHQKAWIIYWVFGIFEGICYLYVPHGVYAWGKPLAHLGGKKLQYYCNGVPSFFLTIALVITLDRTGVFPLDTLIDEFGPIMSVAIISGFLVSIAAYASALYRGATHRMTGYPIYDFFMGAELNPRLLEWLDFKMFFEVRIPWFMLFLTTLGACKKQYVEYGYVSGELGFLLMAHFLYANACCKGEELIPPTWDMYYEKWGFMLIFWNMAGVPLSYCHCTIYLANHHPSTYRWNLPFLIFLYASYLFAYWIWDTAGSQKNTFRAEQRGTIPQRSSFPQLPFRKIKNPQTIPVPSGDDLLCDGWYKYARKIHYTCDMWFALCWGLVTGFGSPFPWFYPVFFALMITHRAQRDIHRCRERYGKAWEEFERRVPYLFIPYVI